MTSPRATTVTSVGFKRWRKRDPWTCRLCGALTTDTSLHAQFHAACGGTRFLPNPGMWSEGGHYCTVHIDGEGHVL